MSAKLQQNGRTVLSSSEASDISGLSRSHILYLVREGKIEGVRPWGREWMIYEDSLLAFLAQPRSPGREGPRKKREIRHTEQGDRVLLSTAEASAVSGYRQDSLLRLLRRGMIEGERSGRAWMIYEDSLLNYTHRKRPVIVESTLVEPVDSPAALSESSSKSSALPATSDYGEPSSSASSPSPEPSSG